MITFTTTRRLAALRAQAGLVPGLRRDAKREATARQQAESALAGAQAAVTSTKEALGTAQASFASRVAELEAAASASTQGAEPFRAQLALRVLRNHIASVKASGDQAAIDGLRALDAMLGPDPEPEPAPGTPLAATQPPAAEEPHDDAPTAGPGQRYHHPHFISAERQSWGGIRYGFREFTGDEPEPQDPEGLYEDDSLDWEQKRQVLLEYEAARDLWHQARFCRDATAAFCAATPGWQAYVRARSAMDAAFAEFRDTEDTRWRAQVLRLGDAQDQAHRAAVGWDRTAAELRRLEHEHYLAVSTGHELSLCEVATRAGIDIDSWHLGSFYGVYRDRLADQVSDAISQQEGRLQKAGVLAPISGSEP